MLGVWLATFAVLRVSSISALAAALASPVLAGLFGGDRNVVGIVLVMALLLVWRHRENIRRLRAGTEKQVGTK